MNFCPANVCFKTKIKTSFKVFLQKAALELIIVGDSDVTEGVSSFSLQEKPDGGRVGQK